MGTKKWAGVAVLVVAPLLLTAGCNRNESKASPSASEAEAALCQQLTTLTAPMDQLKSLDPASATIGDVKKLGQDFVNQVKSLDQYAAQVKNARVNDFETAVSNLDKSLTSVSDSTTIQAAGTNVKTAADGVRNAWTQARNGLGCKS
jgi:hypothetical protein